MQINKQKKNLFEIKLIITVNYSVTDTHYDLRYFLFSNIIKTKTKYKLKKNYFKNVIARKTKINGDVTKMCFN